MISVKRVYEVLKDLANKEQRGFISPSEFNTMAPIAQTAIYNRIWAEAFGVEQMRARNIDGQRGMSKVSDAREELKMYMKSETKDRNADLKFDYPDDCHKLISMKTYGRVLMGVTTSTPIELVYDSHKIDYMLQSTLSAPTIGRPVALVADQIEVYPNSIKKVDVRYYKYPTGITTGGAATTGQPEYGYSIVLGDEVYNSSGSVNFDLPEEREEELVVEIAGMIGTSLRDAALMTYGRQQG